MSRRSSRRREAAKNSAESSLPPNIEKGLSSLVVGNEDLLASMLSIEKGSSQDSVRKALADCMSMNNISAEALLARFFPASVLSKYCIERLGVSGKGNEATLAARIGTKWSKPNFEILPEIVEKIEPAEKEATKKRGSSDEGKKDPSSKAVPKKKKRKSVEEKDPI